MDVRSATPPNPWCYCGGAGFACIISVMLSPLSKIRPEGKEGKGNKNGSEFKTK